MKHEPPVGHGPNPGELIDIAAHWHDRLDAQAVAPAVRAEFDAWLAADPGHRAAFDAVDAMWSRMGEARLDPRVLEMRRGALNAATQRPKGLPRMAAAAAVLALMVGAAWLIGPRLSTFRDGGAGATPHLEGGSLRTAVGERSSVALSDGSVVVLNTNSHVDIRFTSSERRVRLLSGQVWFQVAKSPSRPFRVEAGHERVTALGTAFDVRLDEHRDTVQVTLAEGKVSVERIESPLIAFLKPKTKPAELTPGESLIIFQNAPAEKRRADVANIGSWRRGQLVFDDDTLGAAVEEMNRYSSIQIELAGPDLAAYRVSGVFKAGHSESFVETVTGHYPIRVAQRADGRIVLVPLTR
jgi:transmembrane sensor